jgi:UDP-N-acetylmuramate dehydrogenase
VSAARRFSPEPLLAAAHSVDVGEVRPSEPMARHTTLHVGGPADVMVVPARTAQVERLIALCHRFQAPLTVLGRGSNLLVRDSGLEGVVLLTERLAGLTIEDERIEAWAGVTLGGLANRSTRTGLTGLEWCAGIPGSVGGGVFMNAGAHGGQMADHVRRVAFLPLEGEMPAPAGEPQTLSAADCGFAYRTSRFQSEPGVVLWAELQAEHGDAEAARDRLRRFRDQRKATQPLSWPNCGSVFRNPPGHSAGRLVEAVGGKGHRIGNAGISDVHGNFIVNYGGANAEDVLALIEWAQEAVYQHSGVVLETEVRVLP